ncbi:HVO_A0556 family zinc finger protein [Natrinema versiforme]|uniref:HVO_A0556 family zinc finger protein n=1 Tax=Natrinema versiforme TaxID=88724 RepID=UPI001461484A|nr:HVO_A0556 family zinc finger protein [Natrinema versiforme]
MQRQESGSDLHPVIDALEGTDCSFCDGGELVQDSYKGNDAVVCDVCGTPGAQLW